MAEFYGSCQGERGEAHRLGHWGMRVVAASWHGGIAINLSKDANDNVHAVVEMINWHGNGRNRVLYRGPIDADGLPASVRVTEKISDDPRIIE